MHEACLACGGKITYPLYNPAPQPLAALNLPRSAEAAQDALRFPMNWQTCASCGHIYNSQFDYYKIPYEDNSNLMYNRGHRWQDHMRQLVDLLCTEYSAAGKTIIDIGCGDGLFFKLLLERCPSCRCIGFEPGIEAENARKTGATVYKDYFHPERDLKRIQVDFLLCRHVIEHLDSPRDFVAAIAHWCNRYGQYPIFLGEVPRIDKAVEQGRITDFLYEHVSNFTEFSFRTLFETTGYEVLDMMSCYGDEVAVAWARPKRLERLTTLRRSTDAFRNSIQKQLTEVRRQLDELRTLGKSVAFWGGTGKGAAFLNAFEITAETFPTVIDSDRNKLGRFVPGTAQEIRPPEHLLGQPVDVIVITTRWRAKDIYEEIHRRGITCQTVLVLQGDRLEPYTGEEVCVKEPSVRIEKGHPGIGLPQPNHHPRRWHPTP